MIAFVFGFVTAVCFVTAARTVNSGVGVWASRGYVVGGLATAFVVCGGF